VFTTFFLLNAFIFNANSRLTNCPMQFPSAFFTLFIFPWHTEQEAATILCHFGLIVYVFPIIYNKQRPKLGTRCRDPIHCEAQKQHKYIWLYLTKTYAYPEDFNIDIEDTLIPEKLLKILLTTKNSNILVDICMIIIGFATAQYFWVFCL